MDDTASPPESYLGALGALITSLLVASQEVNRHMLAAVENLLTYVERELANGWPT